MAEPAAIAGSVLNVGATLYGASQEASTLRQNATIDETNAHLAEIDGANQSEAIRRRERATSAEGRAAIAGNGVAVDTGSALDLLTQNAIEREYDILGARYQSASEAASLRTAAAQKRSAAKATMIGGVLKAGAAALSVAGDMRSSGKVTAAQARASGQSGSSFAPGRTFPMTTSLRVPGAY